MALNGQKTLQIMSGILNMLNVTGTYLTLKKNYFQYKTTYPGQPLYRISNGVENKIKETLTCLS